jgi:hypothetical protein
MKQMIIEKYEDIDRKYLTIYERLNISQILERKNIGLYNIRQTRLALQNRGLVRAGNNGYYSVDYPLTDKGRILSLSLKDLVSNKKELIRICHKGIIV